MTTAISTSEIESNIRKAALKEAQDAWDNLHEEVVENFLCLMSQTLKEDTYGRRILPHRKLGDTVPTLAVVRHIGDDSRRNRIDIPKYSYHDDCGIKRVEFHPLVLKEEMKESWIAKECDRLAALKIKHLLESVGVIS